MVLKFCSIGLWLAIAHAGLAQAPREFRGVWVATVANIDWPSQPNLPDPLQQQEFRALLDLHQKNGLNAIVLQIRPAADAFYPSSLEPWSEWLVSAGHAPGYDPLAFCLREAHARGMELHAWFNPYRARFNATDSVAPHPQSIEARHPEWLVAYGKNKYLNPGLPEARAHTVAVVLDVVKRYPLDGVHFDDYFYPYKIEGQAFPDSLTYLHHRQPGQSLDDWRRENINGLIHQLHDSLKRIKPHLSFGISPFGVWRNQDKDPEGSATRAGQTCYDDLYADVRLWLREGWIDYVAPQLYLPIGHERMDFATMVDWWCRNHYGKPIYIGQAAYRIDGETDIRWKNPSQLFEQYRLCRTCPAIQGNIYFSSKSFRQNPLGVNDSLRHGIYRHRAVPPPRSPSRPLTSPLAVTVSVHKRGLSVQWPAGDRDSLNRAVPYVLHIRQTTQRGPVARAVFLTEPSFVLRHVKTRHAYAFAVEAIDRYLRIAATGATPAMKRKRGRVIAVPPTR
ncbi:MAG: family 10 glycosylhydrolase [Cyclobacteriaceae bacterium]|jgi:uncharacterized lipoprotein YddW (UPF0748 family)|nr:family 10 glycosylhydrolase [Cyclobacteriaceae bacterium]